MSETDIPLERARTALAVVREAGFAPCEAWEVSLGSHVLEAAGFKPGRHWLVMPTGYRHTHKAFSNGAPPTVTVDELWCAPWPLLVMELAAIYQSVARFSNAHLRYLFDHYGAFVAGLWCVQRIRHRVRTAERRDALAATFHESGQAALELLVVWRVLPHPDAPLVPVGASHVVL